MDSIPARPSRASVALAYARLPHALPIIVVMASTAAIALVVDPHVDPLTLSAILLAMLGAQIAIGVVNELVDLDLDRVSRPDKPLVSGLVSRGGALTLLGAALALMLAAAAMLGAGSLAICLAGCGIGVAYSVWFKRSVLAWLPYLLAIPLLPIWVAISVDRFDMEWLLAYPLGGCALAAVQIAQSVPDVEADRRANITSLTTKLGEWRSLVMCWGAMAVSAVLVGLSTPEASSGAWVAGCVLLAVALNAVLYRARPRLGVRVAFPIAAVGTALLGVAWVSGVAG